MDNTRDTEGASVPFDAGLERAKRGDSPWLTLGERLAKADLERARREQGWAAYGEEAVALARLERERAEQVTRDIADGIRVLRTRDGVPLTDDMIDERARNIAAGLTGIPLAGVRFGVRQAPDFADGRIR
jgi:hypothetical protein